MYDAVAAERLRLALVVLAGVRATGAARLQFSSTYCMRDAVAADGLRETRYTMRHTACLMRCIKPTYAAMQTTN